MVCVSCRSCGGLGSEVDFLTGEVFEMAQRFMFPTFSVDPALIVVRPQVLVANLGVCQQMPECGQYGVVDCLGVTSAGRWISAVASSEISTARARRGVASTGEVVA